MFGKTKLLRRCQSTMAVTLVRSTCRPHFLMKHPKKGVASAPRCFRCTVLQLIRGYALRHRLYMNNIVLDSRSTMFSATLDKNVVEISLHIASGELFKIEDPLRALNAALMSLSTASSIREDGHSSRSGLRTPTLDSSYAVNA